MKQSNYKENRNFHRRIIEQQGRRHTSGEGGRSWGVERLMGFFADSAGIDDAEIGCRT